jgi:hypothetical protein
LHGECGLQHLAALNGFLFRALSSSNADLYVSTLGSDNADLYVSTLGSVSGVLNNQPMQKITLLLCLALLSFSGQVVAQSENAESAPSEADLTVQDILQRDGSEGDYAKEVSCLNARRMRGTDVIDSRHVAFRMGRDDYYLVQFKNRCLGLRSNRPVKLNMRNSRLCKFDSIQGIDPDSIMGLREGMRCSIPGFTQVTKAQVDQLKVTLKDERQRARELAKEERKRIREERKARRRGDT